MCNFAVRRSLWVRAKEITNCFGKKITRNIIIHVCSEATEQAIVMNFRIIARSGRLNQSLKILAPITSQVFELRWCTLRVDLLYGKGIWPLPLCHTLYSLHCDGMRLLIADSLSRESAQADMSHWQHKSLANPNCFILMILFNTEF